MSLALMSETLTVHGRSGNNIIAVGAADDSIRLYREDVCWPRCVVTKKLLTCVLFWKDIELFAILV